MTASSNPATGSDALFRPHNAYLIYAAVAGVMALVLAWTLWQSFDLLTLVMLLVDIGVGVWSVQKLGTRIQVGTKGLVVHVPLRRATPVEFRQLAAIHEEGRLLKVPVVLYRPLQPDGLVAADGLEGLTLPALKEQARLLALLEAAVPGPERMH